MVNVPVLATVWYVEWLKDSWTDSWFTHGETSEVNAVLQETIGSSWNPVAIVRGVPVSAGSPTLYTCEFGIKKYADDAALAVGPINGTCELDTDGVSWRLSATVPPASQPVSPALTAGNYVMFFKITTSSPAQVKEFRSALELLPAGIP